VYERQCLRHRDRKERPVAAEGDEGIFRGSRPRSLETALIARISQICPLQLTSCEIYIAGPEIDGRNTWG
jgi:hypothetical protein